MNWALEPLKKYAVFEGRARRKEYWYFALFYLLAMIATTIVDMMTGMYSQTLEIGVLSGILVLAIFVPSLSVTVRRLHDTDRSGWWVLIGLIPIIGAIVLLVFMALDSQPGANRFGPNPKCERRRDADADHRPGAMTCEQRRTGNRNGRALTNHRTRSRVRSRATVPCTPAPPGCAEQRRVTAHDARSSARFRSSRVSRSPG